ncbi:hypothetical protein ACJX0J_040694, partial [Zea mays]
MIEEIDSIESNQTWRLMPLFTNHLGGVVDAPYGHQIHKGGRWHCVMKYEQN